MTQVNVQKEMLDTLTGLKQEVGHLKQDIHYSQRKPTTTGQ